MATEQPTEGRCNARAWLNQEEREDPEASKTGYCENYPVGGEESGGTCRMHLGTVDKSKTGAPEGNGNALEHGALASPLNLKDHLNDAETAWVDSLVSGYIEVAPFGYHDPRRERLTAYAVMIYQEWSARAEVLADGASEEQPVGVNDAGRPVIKDQEHHLAGRARVLNTKVRQGLKDLGCLPGSTSAEASGETVAQIFKAAVDQASETEGEAEADREVTVE